ncbi:MAG TPA: hypothetical protein VL651_17480 [Bacteroidia bacterium]|jgi:hypothetical protein|nr:hypothetical protein [Bacteroidia bacterium]
MKRILLLFLFSFLFFNAPAQAPQGQGKLEGGFYAEYYQLGNNGQEQFGGILHIPIGDRFTLNYQLGIGPRIGGGFYVHSPPGVIVAGWLLINSGNLGAFDYLGFLSIAIPQGVGMYFGKGKIISHFSIDPLSVDYWRKSFPEEEKWKLGCNFTYRAKMISDLKYPIYMAPQVTVTYLYLPGSLSPFGVRAGIAIGLEAKNAPDQPIIDLGN